jgi:hypothetical protein
MTLFVFGFGGLIFCRPRSSSVGFVRRTSLPFATAKQSRIPMQNKSNLGKTISAIFCQRTDIVSTLKLILTDW